MKKHLGLLLVIALLSCSSKKTGTPTTATLLSDCPKNGSCVIKLMTHTSMSVTQDAYGMHYTLEQNPEKNVILYTYSKIVKGNIQDAGYREEIIFETDSNISNLALSDADLQNTKMLFGRFCYCKGQTGYYKVSTGKLTSDANQQLSLDFTISEVPQIIHRIKLSLK